MKTNLSLSIPKPCSETWGNFAPTSSGGFCGSCNKIVIDFTGMSDDDILHFFSNKPTHACGRFRSDQLRSYIPMAQVKVNPGLTVLKAGFLSLLMILINKHQAVAQNQTPKSNTEMVAHCGHGVEQTSSENDGKIIRGIVKDESDMALPGVNVLLKGHAEGTTTDAAGRFEFPRKLKEGDVLLFSFIGYDTQEYVVRKNNETVTEITMMMDFTITMGEVAVNEIYSAKESTFQRWWSKVKAVF
jgi:hypothetical protein